MAAKDNIGKAGEALRSNQYLKRLIEDDELRGSLMAAYGAARGAYGRMNNGKAPTKALMEDKKLQRELSDAANALRDAASALKTPQPTKRSRGGFGRSLLILLAGSVLALALSESLRSKVLDLLFGAEEEFDYSSATSPAPEQAAPVEASTA
ncbi:MAG TPA: hypothetical protein VID48_11675 [Solirubrobacteraceae bacterium]|jgi:hypothetical protein